MAEVTLKKENAEVKVLKVNIGKKSYNVPLMGALSIREMKELKDGADDGFDFFGRYIPMDVLESLTMDEFKTLNEAWKNASSGQSDASMGE